MLEIDDLSKRYGPVRALDGASFTARRGRLVGLPRAERRRQDDDDALHLRARDARRRRRSAGTARPIDAATRLRFGYMPEQRGLYPRMRVGEQLAYFGQHHGLSRHDARTQVRRVAGAVRARRTGRSPSSRTSRTATSSGSSSRRRSSTTRSCSSSTSRSAASTRSASRRWPSVLRERARAGVGVVFSSHQLDLVEEVCEDVVIISRGRVVAEGGDRGAEGPIRPAPPRRRGRRQRRGLARRHQPPHRPRARRRPREAPRRRARGPRWAAGRRAGRGRGPPLQLRAAQAVGAVHGGGQRAPAVRPEDGRLLEAVPMSRLRRDPPRRRPGDHRARPEPRATSCRSLFTVILMCVGFIIPALIVDQATPDRARARGRVAGRARGRDPGDGGRVRPGGRRLCGPRRGRGRAPPSATAGSTPRSSVPADLSTAGDLIVLEDAPSSLQAVVEPGRHRAAGRACRLGAADRRRARAADRPRTRRR